MTMRFAVARATRWIGIAAVVGAAAGGPAAAQEGTPYVYTGTTEIAEAQLILKHLGYLRAGAAASGTHDEETASALISFQISHGLRPDGLLDWETMTQLLAHRPAGDADGDGVTDAHDKCPGTPRGAKVDARGCPLDADGDGVPDGLDKCPATPRGAQVDREGCPVDADGDGVFDGLDKCPDTPKGAQVDARGCPRDADGDGVADGLDKCPGTPQGTKVDARGCPLDSDGDGVADDLDRCPDTPRGTKVDARGCPAAPALFEKGATKLVLEGVNFETDSAHLKPESTAVLDRVAASLVAQPEVRIEISGHTDSTGRSAHNLELSRQRAEAVRDYLASQGVAPSRMQTKGFGATQPIADNDTAAGRAKNRRVELRRLD